jgi:hypothetical protein
MKKAVQKMGILHGRPDKIPVHKKKTDDQDEKGKPQNNSRPPRRGLWFLRPFCPVISLFSHHSMIR